MLNTLTLLYIGLGGAVGAVLRVLTVSLVSNATSHHSLIFPYGTILVNVLGSLLIGFFMVVFQSKFPDQAAFRYALIGGFLGGFTTFSAFSLETFNLLEQGNILAAAINVLASVLLCVIAVSIGIWIARIITA